MDNEALSLFQGKLIRTDYFGGKENGSGVENVFHY